MQCPLLPEAIEVVRTTDRSAGPRIVIEAAGNRTSFTVSVPEKPERSTVSPTLAEAMAAFRASDVNAAGAMVAAVISNVMAIAAIAANVYLCFIMTLLLIHVESEYIRRRNAVS